ncbi:MAG: hypothetical protein QME96_01260 [Myxococcota bacterium]|nr:hypothetical protein [Myxococcota bacterium]
MSHEMRPEVRRWGPSAGLFVTADAALDLLGAVSQVEPEINMEYVDEVSRDQYRIVWRDGAGILDRFAHLDRRTMTVAVDEVKAHRGGIESLPDALDLLENLRACAGSWRQYLDPDDGSLELLIDA